MPRFLIALLVLARNAVPILGVFVREWAPPGALLLYLGENIVITVLAALAFRLMAPPDGPEMKTRTGILRTFFLIAAPFTFGAAAISIFVIAARPEYAIDMREIAAGLAVMAIFQILGFFGMVKSIRGIAFADAETILSSALGRVFLLAFAVWAGLFLALAVSTWFVVPFMLLKTLADLYNVRPSALKRRLLRVV